MIKKYILIFLAGFLAVASVVFMFVFADYCVDNKWASFLIIPIGFMVFASSLWLSIRTCIYMIIGKK